MYSCALSHAISIMLELGMMRLNKSRYTTNSNDVRYERRVDILAVVVVNGSS